MKTPKVGDKVTVTDGSSDGHIGIILAIYKNGSIKIRRGDGIETVVSCYYVH